jgi:hypothetical protein
MSLHSTRMTLSFESSIADEAHTLGYRTNDLRKASAQTTYFNWKEQTRRPAASEMRGLKQLEDENGKLKKPVAELPPASCNARMRILLRRG